jgi:hypothetical protein
MENAHLDALVEDFYDYFLDLYQQDSDRAAGVTNPFLAFVPIGTPISPEDFKLTPTDTAPFPQLVTEWLSWVANDVPDVDGTSYIPTSRTVDGMYSLLLEGSQPVPGDTADLFHRVKAEARRDFDAEIGSMRHTHSFRPVIASPSNWADPAANGIWTQKTFSITTRVEVGTPERPPPRPHPKVEPWKFKVLPKNLVPVLSNPALIASQLTAHKAQLKAQPTAVNQGAPRALLLDPQRTVTVSGAVHTISPVKTARLNKAMAINARLSPVAARPRTPIVRAETPTMETDASIELQVSSDRIVQLAEAATPKHSETTELSLFFEYCLVSLRRSWLSQTFLSLRNWYVTGMEAGEFSAGSAGRLDNQDDALLEVIPQAALIVRKLRLSANWSREDRTVITDSVAFGPFSLVGRTFDEVSGSVVCPGMQIAAWICEPLPMLPPLSAPVS